MTWEELGRKIGMPCDGMACARAHMPDPAALREYRALLERDEKAFVQALEQQPQANALALALFLQEAALREDAMRKSGLPEQVRLDTLRDLTIWYGECVRQTGRPGVIEWEWLLQTLRGRLVRLGRLQFQPRRLDGPIEAAGCCCPAGTPVLEVHIPADGRLEPEAVQASLRQAQQFFARDAYEAYCCESWLLSPVLRELLAPDSNILRFQALFTVYARSTGYRQMEERVFGRILDDPSQYPQTTSLQRKVRAFLLSGGRPDMGKGIRRREA